MSQLGPTLKQKQRKKVPVHIISFDNENDEQENTEVSISVSAPPTCLNSPTVTSIKTSTSHSLVSQSQIETNNITTITSKENSDWENK